MVRGAGPAGPGYWEFGNYLGDRGDTPRSLDRGRPPGVWGAWTLKYVKLAADTAPALEVAYQGQRVLLIPPVGGLTADDLPAPAGPLEALVIPGALAGPRDRQAIMARLQPRRVIIYGDPGRSGAARSPWPVPASSPGRGR